jgi:hypothetical protein
MSNVFGGVLKKHFGEREMRFFSNRSNSHRMLECWFFVWYIIMVLILRTQSVEESLLEISRFNLSTGFGSVIKTYFGELKKRLLTTAPIHIVWYIRIIFDCLEVSKCVFISNMIYIRVPPICFKSYLHTNFYQITRL